MMQQPMMGSMVQQQPMQISTAGMYAAPAPIEGAVYGDLGAQTTYQNLTPMTSMQVYQNTQLPTNASVTPGQPFEVTIGQPEQYSTGSATYYTTSLPNASSLPMVPAGQPLPPLQGEIPAPTAAKKDVTVAKKKPKKKKSCGCC